MNDQPTTHSIADLDLHLFNEGTHRRLHDQFGAQPLAEGGVRFAVWAPAARAVHVVGDFDGWAGERRSTRRGRRGCGAAGSRTPASAPRTATG
jgi:1,4-alpha-glucan branching enzyme